jgi:hypothetical protein
MTIAAASKYARRIASGPYGYSQSSDAKTGRWSGLRHTPGNFDCSAASGAIALKGGFVTEADLKGTFYSGNIISRLVSTGMYTAIKVSGLSLAKLKAKVREGDILRGPGHVVYCLGGGKVVSFEASEKGTTHGKVGDQTGREGRVRDLYARSKGWTHIARPVSPETFLGRLIAEYAKGRSLKTTQARLNRRSPWDGPRIAQFVDQWTRLDKGVDLTLPGKMLMVPSTGHAYVVLGSTAAKMRRRLAAGLPHFKVNPASKILVTGKPTREGLTEAAWMRKWLVDHGIAASRIILEEQAGSTVGNALHSVPLLLSGGIASYALVSDASHLRRAQTEFLAALTKLEIGDNKKRSLTPVGLIAFNDYDSGAVIKPTKPVTAATRAAVAAEVAALFGVSAQYKSAL